MMKTDTLVHKAGVPKTLRKSPEAGERHAQSSSLPSLPFLLPSFLYFLQLDLTACPHPDLTLSPPELGYKGFLLFKRPVWYLVTAPKATSTVTEPGCTCRPSGAGAQALTPLLRWVLVAFYPAQTYPVFTSPSLPFLFPSFIFSSSTFFFFFHLFPLTFLTCWLGSKILKTKTSNNKC